MLCAPRSSAYVSVGDQGVREVGEVFAGRYELIDVLDAGGVGTVWRVWDHRQGAYRAAKVLRQSDSDSLLRFVRETSRQIEHAHVVAPYGWSGEDDRVLFTMPLVRGGSLATLLGDFGALPLGWSIELLRQALFALCAVHDAGVVHRDVKPANLLLDPTGAGRPHLRLSDFGAAAQVHGPRLTHANTVIGTPGYFAPEQLRGADPDPLQDVYAVAVVAMQMLTGRQPAMDGDLPELQLDGATGAGLAQLLTRMTNPDPVARPQTGREALDLLNALPQADDLRLGADPENPVEIFDHVPPLPEGWGPMGPEGSPAPAGHGGGHGGGPGRLPEQTPDESAPSTVVLPRERSADGSRREAPAQPQPQPIPRAAWLLALLGVVLMFVAIVLELN